MDKSQRGGTRPGAGRKPLGHATKTISFRIRVEWDERIRKVVREEIKKLKKKKDAGSK